MNIFYPPTHFGVFGLVLSHDDELTREFFEIAVGHYPDHMKVTRKASFTAGCDNKEIRADVIAENDAVIADAKMQNYYMTIEHLYARMVAYFTTTIADSLLKGDSYDLVKDYFIVMVCSNLSKEYDQPVYFTTFSTKSRDGETVRNEDYPEPLCVMIILNLRAAEKPEGKDIPLYNLLMYFRDFQPRDEFTQKFHDAVIRINSEKGEDLMGMFDYRRLIENDARQRGYEQGEAAGLAEGRVLGKKEMILKLKQIDMPIEQIACVAEMSIDEVLSVLNGDTTGNA